MLDCDLAIFYGYEVKALNQQVKRNIERFPEDFRFKTTKEDIRMIREQISYQEKQGITTRSQFVTLYDVNTKTLQLLSQKKKGVNVILFTENGFGNQGFLTKAVVDDFQNQYPSIKLKHNTDCHDRLIVLDYGCKSEKVFHCGASSKDAGKKLCAINAILDTNLIHPVIDKMIKGNDYNIS